MDLAKHLLRSVTRAFYGPEHVLIIDALVLHSALRDDDLAYLMGQQTKHLRKLCGKLKEDGLLAVHSRLEQREGAQRPFSRDYYYIDYHRSIDVIKFRLKGMSLEVERRFGQTLEERREYLCPQCKSEYTQMEVLDTRGADGEFECRRCGHALAWQSADALNGAAGAGHEVQSRLNKQVGPLEALLQQIDGATVPESDFETALAGRLDVLRNESLHPAARTAVVNGGRAGFPAATVHGLRMEPDTIHISLIEDGQASREELAAEHERRARLAAQNALPIWHTASTVTGQPTSLQRSDGADADGPGASIKADADDADDKKPELLQNSSRLDAFFAALNEEQARKREQEAQEDEEEDDEDDDDEADFEDVGFDDAHARDDARRPEKRVRIEQPPDADAGTDSSPASEEKSTPAAGPDGDGDGDVDADAKADGAAARDDDESEEADEFEDAL